MSIYGHEWIRRLFGFRENTEIGRRVEGTGFSRHQGRSMATATEVDGSCADYYVRCHRGLLVTEGVLVEGIAAATNRCVLASP